MHTRCLGRVFSRSELENARRLLRDFDTQGGTKRGGKRGRPAGPPVPRVVRRRVDVAVFSLAPD